MTPDWRRVRVTVVGGGLALSPFVAAGASEHQAVPGSAEGAVVHVEDLAAVSRTSAEAGEDGGQASASVVQVGDRPVSKSVGGTQRDEGAADGAAVDTGTTSLGRAAVAPWRAVVMRDGSATRSDAHAELVRVILLNSGLLDVSLLSSSSSARHSGDRSSASAATDALAVEALDGRLRTTLLHSESSSEGDGAAYVLEVNGTRIGSSDDLGGRCAVTVSVVAASCVTATGGTGDDGVHSAASDVASVVAGPMAAEVLSTTSSWGTVTQSSAQPTAPDGPSADAAGDPTGARNGSRNDTTVSRGTERGRLATTGGGLQRAAWSAIASMLLGACCVAVARTTRRQTHSAERSRASA